MPAKNPTHPGDSVRECMDEMGWSVTELADKLGVCRATVSRLIDGHCGISPDLALALERIGWSNADYWLRRQANYDLAKAAAG